MSHRRSADGNPGSFRCAQRGDAGCDRVPPGWLDWHGLVGNSRYYNATIIDNGVRTAHGDDPIRDYAPDLFFAHTKAFLSDHLANHKDSPFLAVLATPSCHGPFTPAVKYRGRFANESAPRTPNYNTSNEDKQWLMRQLSPITDPAGIDSQHNNRWETLLSVDDYISEVVGMLTAAGQMDNTYFLYSSDHGAPRASLCRCPAHRRPRAPGFQLGQHRLPGDKRHPYQHDLRIPFVLRGPGVPKGGTVQVAVTNADVAPTIVDIATGSVPAGYDGRSILPLLGPRSEAAAAAWRPDFLVTYFGQFKLPCMLQKCPAPPANNWHTIDGANNTFNCVRTIPPAGSAGATGVADSLYCEFDDDEDFVEFYEHDQDPWQLHNRHRSADPAVLARLKARLRALKRCAGAACRDL